MKKMRIFASGQYHFEDNMEDEEQAEEEILPAGGVQNLAIGGK